MTRQFKLFAFTGFVLASPVLLLAQDSDQTPSPAVMKTVEAAFPQDIRYAEDTKSGADSPTTYYTCAAVFSRDADGLQGLIAAAYSGDGAEVAMLANTPSGAKIISASTSRQFWFTDGKCDLQMVNLADRAHPESPLANTIDVTFNDGPDWFFTWDGKKLQNITKLQTDLYQWHGKEVPNSDMYSARVVDVDHTGALQIVGNNGDYDKFAQDDGITSTGTDILFRYNGTTYARAKVLLYLEEYDPNIPRSNDEKAAYKIDTAPWTQEINMHRAPAPSYQLKIVNGDRDGSKRVTSAKVEINGVTIVLPAEVGKEVETLTRTVQLQKENNIKVTVDGPLKSHIYVTLE